MATAVTTAAGSGDVVTSRTATATATTTPRLRATSLLRGASTRLGTAASAGSSNTSSSSSSALGVAGGGGIRIPFLVEFWHQGELIRVGLVGQGVPKHTIPVHDKGEAGSVGVVGSGQQQEDTITIVNTAAPTFPRMIQKSAQDYYRMYASVLINAFHRLGYETKDRRVIVLYGGGGLHHGGDGGGCPIRPFQEAIQRLLLYDLGFIHCCFHPSMAMIPMVFPPPSIVPQLSCLFIIQLEYSRAHCFIHAHGQSLSYTYQSVTAAPNTTNNDTNAMPLLLSQQSITALLVTNATVGQVQQVQDQWISPLAAPVHNLIVAILYCLLQCPRDLRRFAIQNIVVVGEATSSIFNTNTQQSWKDRLLQRLTLVLRGIEPPFMNPAEETVVTSHPDEEANVTPTTAIPITEQEGESNRVSDEVTSAVSSPDAGTTRTTSSLLPPGWGGNTTMTPIPIESNLQSLANDVGILEIGIDSQLNLEGTSDGDVLVRPDLMSWVGASIWAATWHRQDPNAKQFQWIHK